MAKSADKIVSPMELRFKPANSNDAARPVLAHHFVNVPHCSFAKDDGISQYLRAETGMDTFPASPDAAAPSNIDVPAIEGEAPGASDSWRRKLLRDFFGLSIFLHAAAAAAIGYATLTLPDDAPLEEGMVSITVVVEGNADTDARIAGAEEVVKEQEDKPVEVKPVKATTEIVLKEVPMPSLGADLPEILSTAVETEVKTEIAAKPVPVDEKLENPVEKTVTPVVAEKPTKQKPKPVEKKPEAKKKEPKKDKPKKKDRPEKKRKQNAGKQGDKTTDTDKGDVDSHNKGKASTNSRGDVSNREIGNAAQTNYRGLVNRKLSRAKARLESPARGKVKVSFTILANGTVSGLRITQSSGKAALDATALKIVRSASPFPAIPANTGAKTWLMTVPMTFK